MKKLLLTGFIACALLSLTFGFNSANQASQYPPDPWAVAAVKTL